ncbi:MAG: nucleotide exchange factor GrpE [Patescibacteria group bacterium]
MDKEQLKINDNGHDLTSVVEELTEAQTKLLEAKQEATENLAGWQRAQADYANFKKEIEKRQKDIIEFANAAFISELLPIYSHFKLALKHIPEDQQNLDWVIGLKHIQKQFQELLKKYDIKEIKTVGEKFDHNLHEAIVHKEKEGFEADLIFEEVQPGYMLGGKVIMPARVKVAK